MTQIGPYQVREELARGGMGVVFRAHDPALDRDLALKIVRLEELRSEEAQQRFLREVRIMARLRHRHVISVHAAGVSRQGYPYVAMDLIEGGSLKDRLERQGRLPIEEAVRIGIQLAEALDYAHGRGVWHRDLKPHNVLMDGDDALLTDFGLAKWVGADAQGLTRSGDRIGTPLYMAPEQVLGDNERVGPATDVYALGATLFHVLTGVRPFTRGSLDELFKKIVKEPPASLEKARPEVGPALAKVIHRCLEKRRRDRFQTAGHLAEALRACLEGKAVELDAATAALKAPPSPRHRARLALAAGVAGVVGLGLGLLGADPLDRALRRDVLVRELPEELQTLSWRGHARGSRDDHEGALEDFDALIAAEPDCAYAYYQRAQVRRDAGDLQGAVADLNEAIAIDPEFGRALNLRGLIRVADDPQASLADNDRSIELDPLDATYVLNRAGLHFSEGRLEQALADVNRSLKLDPRFGQARFLKGVILERTQGADEALAEWGQGLAAEPGQLDCRLSRAEHYRKRGDLLRAVEDYTAALVSLVEKPVYHYCRAQAREALGDWEGAFADVDAALQVDPEHVLSRAHRAKLHLHFRRYEQAARDYQAAAGFLEEGSDTRLMMESSVRQVREALRRGEYVVEASSLTMREGPGTSHPPVAELNQGSFVRVGQRSGSWAQVTVEGQDGQTYRGWIYGGDLRLVLSPN
jgi:tetratricopeptide (TPR) repeat protein